MSAVNVLDYRTLLEWNAVCPCPATSLQFRSGNWFRRKSWLMIATPYAISGGEHSLVLHRYVLILVIADISSTRTWAAPFVECVVLSVLTVSHLPSFDD